MKTFSIRSKLVGGFVVVAFLGLVAGLAGLNGIHSLTTSLADFQKSSQKTLEAVDAARSAQVAFKTQVQEWKNILLRGQNAEAFAKYRKGFIAEAEKTQSGLGALEVLVVADVEILKATRDLKAAHKELCEKYLGALEKFEPSNPQFSALVDASVKGIDRAPTERIDELVEQIGSIATAHSRQVLAGADSARVTSLIFLVLGTIVALCLGYYLGASISKALGRFSDELTHASAQVAASAQELSSASHSLAECASEQAASLEETGASLEEMSSMTSRNSENVLTAKSAANQARSVADTGVENVKHMTNAIAGIQESTKEMRAAIGAIQISGQEVSKIVKTIDEIAFQTNILALNAAVEAARAGEAGLGFAVVADEVRNLAQRSAKAARETADKIEDSLRKGEEGVRVSQKVAESSMAVTAKATAVGASLEEIVTQIRQLDGMMAQVADASREQNAGVAQINMAVSQIDKTTQTTAATAEESASASQELSAQAVSLRHTVGELKSLMTGRPAAAELAKDLSVKQSGVAASPRRTVTPFPTHTSHEATPAAGAGQGIPMPPRGPSTTVTGKVPAEHDFRDF